MRTLINSMFITHSLMLATFLFAHDRPKRETIGEALGKPVYRDEIRSEANVSLTSELHRLFTSKVIQQYREAHKEEITPTPEEIAVATRLFDNQHRKRIKPQEAELQAQLESITKQLAEDGLADDKKNQLVIQKRTIEGRLKPPGESFAAFMLQNWKFQRYLYKEFGGGRLLFQQAGMEAFDATRTWLETFEREGKFRITDPKLRAELFHYWTTQNHGAFLIDDKERIRAFLVPEWLKPQAP